MVSKGRFTRSNSTKPDHEDVPDVAPAWLQKFAADILISMKQIIEESTAGIAHKAIEKIQNTTENQSAIINYMQKQNRQLNERVIKLESRTMRDNLMFCGIKEEQNGPENLKN